MIVANLNPIRFRRCPVALDFRSLIMPVATRALTLRERLESGAVYNPLEDAFHQNPYPTYARLRRKDRVHWSYLANAWILTWWEDVDAVLRDHRRFSNDDRNGKQKRRRVRDVDEAMRSILVIDPPDHTRLRGLVSKAFSARAIAQLEPRIREIVDGILAPLEDGAEVDIMDALAFPLPVTVIAEMIGVPPADRDRFKLWSDAVARTLEPTISEEEMIEAEICRGMLRAYFLEIIDERRAHPREDLLSALIAAEEEGDKLSEEEMLTTLILLLVAGNETTTNLIGNVLLALLRHPEQLQLLRENPDLMESAVEELLRFDSPVQTDGRFAMEDIELGGKIIRKGDSVLPLIGSANRDPRHFQRPRELDITRNDRSHISFGRGIHHCLGAPLARLEGRIAFEALLAQFPRIELTGEPPVFKDHVVLRGMKSLRVRVHRS
jgi:cytochrome P450